jgi:hypothetical protein
MQLLIGNRYWPFGALARSLKPKACVSMGAECQKWVRKSNTGRGRNFYRGHRRLGCESQTKKESIAQRSRRWIGVGGRNFYRGHRQPGYENQAKKESIARRGDWGWWAKLLPGTLPAWARESDKKGKHRTEVTEGGLGLVGETSTGDTASLGARIRRNRKASHRGHGDHGGESGLVGGELSRRGPRLRSPAPCAMIYPPAFAVVLAWEATMFPPELSVTNPNPPP